MQNQKLLQVLQNLTQKVNVAADQAGQKVEGFVQNDATLRPILITAHAQLPFFVRILLKEEKFVEFVLRNREKLLVQRRVSQTVSEIVKKFLMK